MKKASVAVIVVLLVAIVGYLALDRRDKDVADEKSRNFAQKYFK